MLKSDFSSWAQKRMQVLVKTVHNKEKCLINKREGGGRGEGGGRRGGEKVPTYFI